MSAADEYNVQQQAMRNLLPWHITALVKAWQESHGLDPDGKAGPMTIASLGPPAAAPAKFLRNPLPRLPDGRIAEITSEFRPADRPNHDGIDWFYHWRKGDQPDFVGDHGAAGRNADGTPKWVVPTGVPAVAAADGVVQLADNSPTGYRVWIDHGNGLRTGYFHLLSLSVKVGQRVVAGASLGPVGDNPSDNDGRHLHFELSPVSHYAPMDPTPYLK